jgi:hypothetical protein
MPSSIIISGQELVYQGVYFELSYDQLFITPVVPSVKVIFSILVQSLKQSASLVIEQGIVACVNFEQFSKAS